MSLLKLLKVSLMANAFAMFVFAWLHWKFFMEEMPPTLGRIQVPIGLDYEVSMPKLIYLSFLAPIAILLVSASSNWLAIKRVTATDKTND